MFTGDAPGGSGEWLARALHAHGFATQPTSRHRGDGFELVDAYITAAIHCAPPDNRPLPVELRRCAAYLREELALLRRSGWSSRSAASASTRTSGTAKELGWNVPRPRPRFAHGASVELPWGVTLLATYHPSRQNTQTGRLTWAMFDAVFAEARRRLSDAPMAPRRAAPPPGSARAR